MTARQTTGNLIREVARTQGWPGVLAARLSEGTSTSESLVAALGIASARILARPSGSKRKSVPDKAVALYLAEEGCILRMRR